MTFSNQVVQKNDPTQHLKNNLENFGKQEISIWRETVLHDESLFAEIYKLIYCGDPRIAWHAAWVIETILAEEATPGIISKGRRILQSLKLNDAKKIQKRGLK